MLNMTRSLFTTGYIQTTSPKAKALKSYVDKFIASNMDTTDLVTRRNVQTVLGATDLVKKYEKYVKEVAPKTSIMKISFRAGDAAEKSKIVLVGFDKLFEKKKVVKKVAKKEEATEEVVENKPETKHSKKGNDGITTKIASTLQKTFVNKQRATSRSGL
jgi:ribosomal protein L17